MRTFLDRFTGNISFVALLTSTFFWSWFDLVPFSPVLPMAAGRSADPLVLSVSLLVGTAVLGAFAVWSRLRSLALDPRFFALCSFIFGCLGAVLLYAGAASDLAYVSMAGGVLMGAYQGMGAAVVGCLTTCQGKTNALIHIAACLPLNVVFVLLGMFLQPEAAVVLCALLPLLSALCFKIYLVRGLNEQIIHRVTVMSSASTTAHASRSASSEDRRGDGPAWQRPAYIVLLLVITMAFGFMNCRVMFFGAAEAVGAYTDYASLFIRAVVAVTVFCEYFFRSRQPYSLLKVALLLMFVSLESLVITISAGAPFRLAACSLFYAGYALFDLLIWAIIVIMHRCSHMSLQRFVYIVYTFDQLGIAAGNLVGSALFPDILLEVIFGVMGIILALLSFLILNERSAIQSGLCTVVIEDADVAAAVLEPGTAIVPKPDGAPTHHGVQQSGSLAGERVFRTTDAAALQQQTDILASRYFLTAKEKELLMLLLAGRSVPYISDHLMVSQNTVKTHVRHIYMKLDVHNRQELLDLLDRPENLQ